MTDGRHFYTGLVAELYDPLVSFRARAEDFVPLLASSGTPALELGCGSGHPILDWVRAGYEVDGLDASADMLALCRARADAEGLSLRLYEAEMQRFSLPRRYRSIFLVGATFSLLPSDDDARAALACIREHLEPGGTTSIPLELPDEAQHRESLGVVREATDGAGRTIRVRIVDLAFDASARRFSSDLRYEREHPDGTVEHAERRFERRWWTQDQFTALCEEAGLSRIRMRGLDGRPAPPRRTLLRRARRARLTRFPVPSGS